MIQKRCSSPSRRLFLERLGLALVAVIAGKRLTEIAAVEPLDDMIEVDGWLLRRSDLT